MVYRGYSNEASSNSPGVIAILVPVLTHVSEDLAFEGASVLDCGLGVDEGGRMLLGIAGIEPAFEDSELVLHGHIALRGHLEALPGGASFQAMAETTTARTLAVLVLDDDCSESLGSWVLDGPLGDDVVHLIN